MDEGTPPPAPSIDAQSAGLSAEIQDTVETLGASGSLGDGLAVLSRLSSLLSDVARLGDQSDVDEIRTLTRMISAQPKAAGDLEAALTALERRIYRRRFRLGPWDPDPGLYMGAGMLVAMILLVTLFSQFTQIYGPIDQLFHDSGHTSGGHSSMLTIVTAGFTGAIVSLFIRINGLQPDYARNRAQYFLDGFFRPYIGATFAVVITLAFKSGLMGVEISEESEGAFLLIVAFLSGFSERFSRDLVTKLGAKVQPKA